MAYSDYLHCAVCDCKVIYDAEVDYENSPSFGSVLVLCADHDKTHHFELVETPPLPSERERTNTPTAQMPLSTDGSYLLCSHCGARTHAVIGIGLGHSGCCGTWTTPAAPSPETEKST